MKNHLTVSLLRDSSRTILPPLKHRPGYGLDSQCYTKWRIDYFMSFPALDETVNSIFFILVFLAKF